MSTDTQVRDLLLVWENSKKEGRPIAVEELCRECPELIPVLKRQIAALQSVDRLLASRSEQARGTLKPASAVADLNTASAVETVGAKAPREEAAAAGASSSVELRPGGAPVPGYTLVSVLGRGGFGEVWKAIAPGGFPVALKIMPLRDKVKSTELQALEIIKQIRHPNLVTAFGAWQTDGWLIVAMELADRTLWDRYQEALAQGLAGIPAAELLEYMREAAKGIDFLNQPHHNFAGKDGVSIQHRDIKPQNILLVGNSVKVADFSLVRLLERSLTSHTGSMTPAYAAPEFMRGQTSSQSDQYCLAVTYCELRGGRLPFSGTLEQLISGHLTKAPDLSMLPLYERAIVKRALAKQPSDRWSNCRTFVESLAKAQTQAASAPRSSHGTRWFAMTCAAALVGLMVAFFPRPAPTPSPPGLPQKRNVAKTVVEMRTELPDVSALAAASEKSPESASGQPAGEPIADSAAAQADHETNRAAAAGVVPAKGVDAQVVDTPGTNATAGTRPQPPVGELLAFRHHQGPVRSVAISPSGGLALSAGEDRAVWLWNAETGQALHRFDGHTDVVHCVAFSHDGRLAMSASADRSVRLWDIESLAPTGKFNGHSDAVYSAAFFADDLLAVSAGQDTRLRVWNVADRAAVTTLDFPTGESVWGVAIDSTRRRLLTASDSTYLRLWSIDRGIEEHRFEDHRDTVWCVAISADGAWALSGGGLSDGEQDYDLRLWNLTEKKLVRKFRGHTGAVGSVAFSRDGRRAVSGAADKTVRLWDVDTAGELHYYERHTGSIHCVAVSHDGTRAFSASHDGTVRVWSLSK
jgi:serine/threonine protein kinase